MNFYNHKLTISLVVSALLCLSSSVNAQQTNSTPVKRKSYTNASSGTMNMSMPTSSNDSTIDKILYPQFGQYSFYTSRYCGDGDVARYYAGNPQEDNGVGMTNASIVLGYWIDDGTSVVPTKDNWFASAYSVIATESDPVTKLYKANSKNEISALGALSSDYKALMNLARYAPEKKQYKFYAAAMMCKQFQDGGDPSKESPTAIQISNQLLGIAPEVENKLNSRNSENGLFDSLSVTVLASKDKFDFQIGHGQKVDNDFSEVAKEIFDTKYTDSENNTPSLGQVRAAFKDSLKLAEQQIEKCEAAVKNAKRKYWFEPFALNISCNSLLNSNATLLLKALSGEENSSVSSVDEFNDKKNKLINNFIVSAVQETIQDQIENSANFNQNKTRCFDPSQRYLNKLMASLVIPFKVSENGKYKIDTMPEMTLPEGNYALGAATKYYENENAIFMNFVSNKERPAVAFSKETRPDVDFNATLTFNFHVRDVGCHKGVFYCMR